MVISAGRRSKRAKQRSLILSNQNQSTFGKKKTNSQPPNQPKAFCKPTGGSVSVPGQNRAKTPNVWPPGHSSGEHQPDLTHLLMPNINDTELTHKVLQIRLEMHKNTQGSCFELSIPLARETSRTGNKSSAGLRLLQSKIYMSVDFAIHRFHCVSASLDRYYTPQNFLGSLTMCSVSAGFANCYDLAGQTATRAMNKQLFKGGDWSGKPLNSNLY